MATLNRRILLIGALALLRLVTGAQTYTVRYLTNSADSVRLPKLSLTAAFPNRIDAAAYVGTLLPLLQGKGFVTASVDEVRMDTAAADVRFYLGEQYRWTALRTEPKDAALLESIRFSAAMGTMDFAALPAWQAKVLDYLEDNGHPFGKTYLDSIGFNGSEVVALLKIDRGPKHLIDSINVVGDARVNNAFLQKYLEIQKGSRYNRTTLLSVSKKLAELGYVEEERPSDLTMKGGGSVLNLYLKSKRISQVNALVGLLPNTEQLSGARKFQLTVDANVLLRNALGSGETIGLVWQQLQKSSPRLNLLYEQPYVFKSPVGIAFSLDMYKRDSIFLNINMNLGVTYRLAGRQTASVFVQRRQSIVNGINAASVIQSKRLPEEADVSSLNLGVSYDFNATDYRFNPRRGRHFYITTAAGTKKLRKNNLILELKDPSNPGYDFESLYDTVKLSAYQFRILTTAAQYLPLGKQTTLKLGLNGGVFQSPSVYRNELFQIGGNRLLRGFDEESQFVSQYAVGTAEFRLITGLNSNFFTFVDGGWAKHPFSAAGEHTYVSGGLGLSFQPQAGLINVTYAVGKRNDTEFNLRQSRIHIGFVSFF